jgi:hypothetical protein
VTQPLAVVLYQNVYGAGRDVNIPTNDVDRPLGDLIVRGLILVGVTYFDVLGDGMDAFDAATAAIAASFSA